MPPAWDDAMEVGMMEKVLPPGVEEGEKTDLRAQMFGVGSH